MSLVEVLVSGSLALLLGVMLWWVLGPLLRTAARTTTQVELAQSGLAGLGRMAADVQMTTYGGLSAGARGTTLGVVPLRSVASDGSLVWDTRLIIYSVQGGRLLRREYQPAAEAGARGLRLAGQAPVRPDPTLLDQLAQADGSEQVLAQNVDSLQVQGVDASMQVAGPVTLRLHLSKATPARNEPSECEFTRVVTCKQPL